MSFSLAAAPAEARAAHEQTENYLVEAEFAHQIPGAKHMREWMINNRRLRSGILCLWPLAFALAAAGTPAENSSQPYVTCQLAENGVTDDGPAINACLKEHPGRHIMLRKTGSASFGGGQATSKDIYSSQTLTMVGDAQWLDCDVPAL